MSTADTETMPTIAITGANGFLGTALCHYFIDAGWHVVGLVRRPDEPGIPGVIYRAYDIAQPVDAAVLDGVTYLVHAAYVKYDRDHPDALKTNLEGARQLIEAADRHKLRKLLFVSTMSAHDDATSIYGRQKLEIERLFLSQHNIVLRSGLILGNGGIVKQMSAFMRSKHVVPLIAGGHQPLQVIAVYDLARVIEKALSSPLTGRFTAATPQIYSYKQFYQALAKRMRIKIIFVPVPYSLLMVIFKTISLLKLPLGVGEDNLRGLQQLKAMESAADLRQLGVELDPLAVALQKVQL